MLSMFKLAAYLPAMTSELGITVLKLLVFFAIFIVHLLRKQRQRCFSFKNKVLMLGQSAKNVNFLKTTKLKRYCVTDSCPEGKSTLGIIYFQAVMKLACVTNCYLKLVLRIHNF